MNQRISHVLSDRRAWMAALLRMQPIIGWGLVIIIVVDSLFVGVAVRQWLWDSSADSIRFPYDISNGWNRGSHVVESAVRLAGEMRAKAGLPARVRLPGEPEITWREFLRGYRAEYDSMVREHPGGDYGLDYSPVRLLIMSGWVKYTRDHHPGIGNWRDNVVYPLLWLNTACEFAAALAGGLLVGYWAWRARPGRLAVQGIPPRLTLSAPVVIAFAAIVFLIAVNPTHILQLQEDQFSTWIWGIAALYFVAALLVGARTPLICGTIAFLLIWFNPTMIVEAHAWPQWDVWIIPMYLLAALLVSIDCTFFAGVFLAVGAMMKGQILLAGPLLVLWPLFEGRFASTLRLMLGFLTAGAAMVSIWLVPASIVWVWIGCAMLAVVLLLPWVYWSGAINWKLYGITVAAMTILTAWPFAHPWQWIGILLCVEAIVLAARWTLRWRSIPLWMCGAFATSVTVAAVYFGGSTSWFDVGFDYGTRHFDTMHMGATNNLAALLEAYYNWHLHDFVGTLHLPWHLPATTPAFVHWTPAEALEHRDDFEIRSFMKWVYVLAIIPCAAGAAAHARRNDPRILIALIAPWILFNALLPQMHERYCMWAAGISAIAAGVSIGMTLLHFVVAGIAAQQILLSMLFSHPSWAPRLQHYLVTSTPGLSWMMMLLAGIYFVCAMVPSRPSHFAMRSSRFSIYAGRFLLLARRLLTSWHERQAVGLAGAISSVA